MVFDDYGFLNNHETKSPTCSFDTKSYDTEHNYYFGSENHNLPPNVWDVRFNVTILRVKVIIFMFYLTSLHLIVKIMF